MSNINPDSVRCRAVGNAVFLENPGNPGNIASWGEQSRETAAWVAGQIESQLAVQRRTIDRLREALTWAVGFLQCNFPKTVGPYPDYRNACDLLAEVGLVITGEFHTLGIRAELAEGERDKLRDGLLRVFRRCENWSAEDVRANVADILGCRVEELENMEDQS